MANLLLPLYSHNNGTFIMIIVFAIVCLGLVAAVILMMNSDKKKKNDQ
jgi:signal transduction histidine kinase